MKIIVGKYNKQKIRVPEFHKNGKKNKKFDWYLQFVNKDEVVPLMNMVTEKIICRSAITKLRIKEV